MRAEQELRYRNTFEEPQRFEHQRQDDPEGRQDRDQRGRQQGAHHPPFDAGSSPEVQPRSTHSEPRRGDRDHNRDRATDRRILRLGIRVAARDRRRLRVEPCLPLSARNFPGFDKDGVALHVELGKRLALGTRKHSPLDHCGLNRSPHSDEQKRRNRCHEHGVSTVIDRQRVKLSRTAKHFGPAECEPAGRSRNQKDDGERQGQGHRARRR